MLCPSEFRDRFRPVVFAQSPFPDWAKQIFSANSASLRLLLNVFTSEAQRTPREGIFCWSGDDDKQKDSSEREGAGRLTSSRKIDSEEAAGARPSAGDNRLLLVKAI
jgi:hypothetical protein